MTLPRPPTGNATEAWYIHHEQTTTYADLVDGAIPQTRPGNSESYPLAFGVDLPPGADTLEWQDRYTFVRDTIGANAGRFAAHTDIPEQPPEFREQTVGTRTLLVKLEPAHRTTQRGVWGLVESVSDGTAVEPSHGVLDVSVLQLAHGDEYEGFDEIRADLEF